MKISKKIFGVVLALIMIFNVFAVGAFAAVPADTAVDLRIRTDKTTYAPGEEVVLTFGYDVADELTAMQLGGQYEIAFNDKVIEPYSTNMDVGKAGEHGFVAIQGGYNSGLSSIQCPSTNSTGISPLYDWNQSLQVVVADDMGETKFDARGGIDVLSIKMKIKADAPNGTYTIGYNPYAYEEYAAFVNDGIGLGGLYGVSGTDLGLSVSNTYAYGTCTFTVGEPAPAFIVTHGNTKIQWANDAKDAVNLGFMGEFKAADIAIAFNEIGTSTNINRVGVELEDGTQYDTRFVYTPDEGVTYQFRAVVTNIPEANYGTDIKLRYFVEPMEGEIIYSDWVVDNAAAHTGRLPA